MAGAFVLLLVFIFSYCLATAIYRVTLHPLAGYPGPWLWAISRVFHSTHSLRGNLPYKVAELHQRYGPVVRIAPTELSYTSAEAWSSIYGKSFGKAQLMKDPKFAPTPPDGVHGIQLAPNDEDHRRMRKNFLPAFSEKSVREQEPLLSKYLELLMQRLADRSGSAVDVEEWYNLALFDMIGDLTFGESFECLEKSHLHTWAASIFKFIKAVVVVSTAMKFSPLDKILLSVVPESLREQERLHRSLTREKLSRRLRLGNPRSDFMSYAQEHVDTNAGLSMPELQETATVLVIAGSETTATLLSGLTYLLLHNPKCHERLVHEIRSAFKSEAEITMASTSTLKYMLACIEEGLRLFPPVPSSMARLTPPEGSIIAGRFVAGNTLVAVNQWSAFRSPSNFSEPDLFVPERWLGHSSYTKDVKQVLQPFSVGPRSCLGRTLAYAQIRVIIARMFWNFDMSLREESQDWMKSIPIYLVYDKGPLTVDLKLSASSSRVSLRH